jgi:hypothetical protein
MYYYGFQNLNSWIASHAQYAQQQAGRGAARAAAPQLVEDEPAAPPSGRLTRRSSGTVMPSDGIDAIEGDSVIKSPRRVTRQLGANKSSDF